MPTEKPDAATPAGATVSPAVTVRERRRWPRYSLTAATQVTELNSMARIEGRCTDLSAGGCYVDTLNPFPTGSMVQVVVTQGERRFTGQACVAFSQPGMGMGLAFMEMDSAERANLHAWLEDLGCAQTHVIAPAELERPAPETVRGALMHLIHLLVRKRVLSNGEGEELLRELLH
jgi:hypothetical protein